MEGEKILTLADLEGLTDTQILELLAAPLGWPWDEVWAWFLSLWNMIIEYFHKVVDWIETRLKPLFDKVWGWIKSEVSAAVSVIWSYFLRVNDWIIKEVAKVQTWIKTEVAKVYDWLKTEVGRVYSWIVAEVAKVYAWIQSSASWLWTNVQAGLTSLGQSIKDIASTVAAKVSEINAWFSNEFIDPFIDWLIQFPGKLYEGFKNFFVDQWNLIWNFWSKDWNWLKLLTGMVVVFIGGAILLAAPAIGAAVVGATQWLGGTILCLWGAISGWLASMFSVIGSWFLAATPAIGAFFSRLFPKMLGWLAAHWTGLALPSVIIGLEATGIMDDLVQRFVAPVFQNLLDWVEKMGPVSPDVFRPNIKPLSGMIEMTIGGLSAMTLAGETLGLWKHIGMGHISAMLWDLTNYKLLTAAFVGVLAGIYIKTPLTYYYNKIARPNIPNERSLMQLLGEYVITDEEFGEGMAFQGYNDEWIPKLSNLASRPLTPRMLNYLATVGITDPELIDRELKHSAFDERTIPYIKTWLQRVASGDLKALMASLPVTRYKEGFDDETALRANLTALDVAPEMLTKYVFASNLSYLYDYQSDLKTYYIDAYHRRDIEEPELRTNLISIGLAPERLDLVVEAQKIKRLALPKAVDAPELAIQFDTIRDRRKKLLITRAEEISALVTLGKELPYALAIADNDDAAIAEKAVKVPPVVPPLYETEEGRVRVDTIRRLRRQRQITPDEEISALAELEMPKSLAQAIADNDELRLRKGAEGE